MTLLDSELARIKAELGFNLLGIGAEPYIGITRFFEQIAIPNLSAGAVTTSSTTVTAVADGASVTPVTLTVDSATGIAMFNRVVIDVDDLTEMATVRAVSGSTITVALRLAHTGTYPIQVEGGESLVRYYLAKCRTTAEQISEYGEGAGIKSIDKEDVVFFGGYGERTAGQTLGTLLKFWRSELCKLLFGCGDLSQFGCGGGGGQRLSLY